MTSVQSPAPHECTLHTLCSQAYTHFFGPATTHPLNKNKLMGFHSVFMDNTWAHDLGFYWSFSAMKALVRGIPVREATKNANKREFLGLGKRIQPSKQQQNQGLTPLCCFRPQNSTHQIFLSHHWHHQHEKSHWQQQASPYPFLQLPWVLSALQY